MVDVKTFIANMDSKMATMDKEIRKRKKYKECNNTLPDNLPYLTKEECKKAYPLLVRKFGRKETRHPYKDEWVKRKMGIRKVRPMGKKTYETYVRKCWICLSGSPNELSKGWRRLIHDVSHMVHTWLRPNLPDHCYQQAELELDMIKYIQFKGWLKGSLKPKLIVLTKDEQLVKKINHLETLINKWQRRQKTAITFIRKYNKKLKYYQNKK